MRKRKRQKNNATINLRLRKSDLELFDRAADILGITRSGLIRHAATVQAMRTLGLSGTLSLEEMVAEITPENLHPET